MIVPSLMKFLETPEERANRATKCRCCGMPLLPQHKKFKRGGSFVKGYYYPSREGTYEYIPKYFCNITCRKMYDKYPEEFGFWWQ